MMWLVTQLQLLVLRFTDPQAYHEYRFLKVQQKIMRSKLPKDQWPTREEVMQHMREKDKESGRESGR